MFQKLGSLLFLHCINISFFFHCSTSQNSSCLCPLNLHSFLRICCLIFPVIVLQTTMKNSYSFVDEVRSSPYYNAFDPYEDFCQVLEEAKQHGQEAGSQLLEPEKEKLVAVRIQVKDKNNKKSWKASSVISWLRGGKLRAKPPSNPAVLKPNNVSVSGPMCSGEGRDYVKPKLQLSGQLNGLFTPLKKVETSHSSMQYGSLPKPDSKSSNGPYGPMYTVR